MPNSDFRNIVPVVEAVLSASQHPETLGYPMRVLDVGAGFGKYGVILRERLDVAFCRYDKLTWKSTIDAVEIWPAWITSIHHHVYDNVFIEDARFTVDARHGYDVVLLGDVIEHFDKEEGKELVKKFAARNGAVVLCIPDGEIFKNDPLMGGSEGYLGNEFELHRSLWFAQDFPVATFYEHHRNSGCFIVKVVNPDFVPLSLRRR